MSLRRAIDEAAAAAGLTLGELAQRAWPALSPEAARRKLERARAATWLPKLQAIAAAAGTTVADLVKKSEDRTSTNDD